MQKQEEVISRLKQIFDIFLRENFSTTNNVYFEKLISHLQAKENAFVLQAPLAIEWVDTCLKLIDEDSNKVHSKVISFMLNLTSFMTCNEWIIIKMRQYNIMSRVINLLKAGHDFSPSIKLGGIRVMKALTTFSVGIAYMRHESAWPLLIQYSNSDHTLYVVREARHLLVDVLFKYCDKLNDEAGTLEIIAEILRPITDNVYQISEEHIQVCVDDNELLHKISSTLDLLTYILQQTLVLEERTNLVLLLKQHHNFDLTIWKLMHMTHNSYFTEKILTTLTSYHFAHLVHQKLLNPECTEATTEFTEFGLSFFNMMKFCIQRGEAVTLVKMAELNHKLWKKLGTRAPKEVIIEHQTVAFENQLIIFHILPLLFSIKFVRRAADEARAGEGDPFDTYIMQLMEMSCQQTLRLCYSLRDAFFTAEGSANGLYTVELANKCIHSILALENVLDKEQAVIVCQALLYVLKEVVTLSEATSMDSDASSTSSSSYLDLFPRGTELIVKDPKVLHSIMVGLQTLIEHFKITWKESVETIGLVNCLAFVLENCNMDARCTVQALKLVQLAVEHFLSPNMALLVDNLQGSALVCLGPIIVKRMHDSTWEVRDTTLELTTAIACISRIKFPAFQSFLNDAKIPPIVYEMAKHDAEPYVRASAFKCLSKMVSINALWERGLSQLDLVDHLLYVLYRDNDDIVRTEAIITLSKIYEHRKIPTKYKNTLFSTLNYCVVGDHHWEVKNNALKFWRMEFQRQFNNQGMIDGIFPTVTFSKEHKKIVTLTQEEIKLRIAKVFVEVQQYGYFGVQLRTLNEEYSMEVVMPIVCGIKIMYEKLKKLDIDIILAHIDTLTPSTSNPSGSFPSEEPAEAPMPDAEPLVNREQADEVIESILDAQDVHLLEKAFESQMQINKATTEKRHIDEFYYKQFAVPARVYMDEISKMDLDQLVKQQQEWFECKENFVSLLDDILNAIKRDDENMVSDCY